MEPVAVITLTSGGPPRALGWLAAATAPALMVNGMFLDAEFETAFLLWIQLASVVLTVRPDLSPTSARSVPDAPPATVPGTRSTGPNRS